MSALRMARPLLPSTSDKTLPSFRFASSGIFWMREECWEISRTGAGDIAQFLDGLRRYEARANQPVREQIGDLGASFTSVLRPETLRMCRAVARTSSKCPSCRCHTGFQYQPVA